MPKSGTPWFPLQRKPQRGESARRVGGLEDNRMKKCAVTAHPAIRAQGLGDFSRNRVHQEKLKQKAGADDNGQHRLVDHFLTKWTWVSVSFFCRPFCRRRNLRHCRTSRTSFLWWSCDWYHLNHSDHSERRWVRGIRLGRLGLI